MCYSMFSSFNILHKCKYFILMFIKTDNQSISADIHILCYSLYHHTGQCASSLIQQCHHPSLKKCVITRDMQSPTLKMLAPSLPVHRSESSGWLTAVNLARVKENNYPHLSWTGLNGQEDGRRRVSLFLFFFFLQQWWWCIFICPQKARSCLFICLNDWSGWRGWLICPCICDAECVRECVWLVERVISMRQALSWAKINSANMHVCACGVCFLTSAVCRLIGCLQCYCSQKHDWRRGECRSV